MSDSPPVDSRWWYVVAAATVYEAVVLAALFVVVPLLLLGAVGVGLADPVAALGLSAVALFVLVVPLLLLGMLLALLFPVAIYLDAEAVADADCGWAPDSFLYGLLGAAGLVAGGAPIQPIVGLYYLYRRHQHAGVP